MTVSPSGPEFPIQDIPFSYRGSWFNISPVVAEKTYADDLHLVSHQTGLHPVLRLTPAVAGTTVVATPALLTWRSGADRIEAVYDGPDTLRIRGRRLGLRVTAAASTLTPFSGTYLYVDPVDGSHVFTSYETGRRYRITVLSGALARTAGAEALGTADRSLDLPGDQPWEIAIEEYATARRPYAGSVTFEQLCRGRIVEFTAFVDAIAPWRGADTPAAELAAYVLWSATVAPAGFVTRPAVLMSKHWMDKVWSWDHCFNAIALASGEPELAWHQFHLPFDHQDESGALPDSIAHSEVLHNYVKPPFTAGRYATCADAFLSRWTGRRWRRRTTGSPGGPGSGSTRAEPPATTCPTTSTATTAAGTTRPRSTAAGFSRRPTSPRSWSRSCAAWRTSPPSWASPPTSGPGRPTGSRAPCSGTCGTANVSPPATLAPGIGERAAACST